LPRRAWDGPEEVYDDALPAAEELADIASDRMGEVAREAQQFPDGADLDMKASAYRDHLRSLATDYRKESVSAVQREQSVRVALSSADLIRPSSPAADVMSPTPTRAEIVDSGVTGKPAAL